MNKTGILTFHAAYNFGSNLQAYALQKTIEKLGYEVEIINFRPEIQRALYSIINTKIINKGSILKNICNVMNYSKIKNRNARFESFIKNKLVKNTEVFLEEGDVKKIINNYTNVVCGSDQIWNLSEKTYDRSKIYYLDFDNNVNSIAYAPSFGNDINLLKNNWKEINTMVKKFKHISLREKDAVDYFNENGIKAQLALDPTLLLDKVEWNSLIDKPIINEPYILYYSLNGKKFSIDVTKQIQNSLKIKVINPYLHPRSMNSGFNIMSDAGPLEFLNLIKYAECICTNSFHGTVFSILLEKPFYAIFDEKDGKIIRENRKASLLEQLGLEKNMVSISNIGNFEEIKSIDYKEVKSRLNRLKETSISFLKKSLGDNCVKF